jgi:hypothetical protein
LVALLTLGVVFAVILIACVAVVAIMQKSIASEKLDPHRRQDVCLLKAKGSCKP